MGAIRFVLVRVKLPKPSTDPVTLCFSDLAKPEDPNAQHANLRIFTTATGEEAMAFTQKAQENWYGLFLFFFPGNQLYLSISNFFKATLVPSV